MSAENFLGIEADSLDAAFYHAAAQNMFGAVKKLVRDGADLNYTTPNYSDTALNYAVSLRNSRMARLLIELGADVNAIGAEQLTPLMTACSEGGKKGSALVILLLEAGADANHVRTSDEMTGLKFAVEACSEEALKALIAAGAEVDGPHGTDQTALMLAARLNNVEALKILVEYGADPTLTCGLSWASGLTARELAALEKQKKAERFLASLPV